MVMVAWSLDLSSVASAVCIVVLSKKGKVWFEETLLDACVEVFIGLNLCMCLEELLLHVHVGHG